MPKNTPEERREYYRHYRAKNLDKLRAYKRKWDLKNAEKMRAYFQRRHVEKNEEIRDRMREYYVKNRRAIQAKIQQWQRANPKKFLQYQRRWQSKNRDKTRELCKRYRARRRGAPLADFTSAQWELVQAHFKYRCVYCGKKPRALTQDHITPLSLGGMHTMANIVPACRSCNSKKFTGPVLIPIQPLLL